MNANPPGANDAFSLWLGRRPALAKTLGYSVFGAGIIMAAMVGAAASFLIGAPVVVYRRVHPAAPPRRD